MKKKYKTRLIVLSIIFISTGIIAYFISNDAANTASFKNNSDNITFTDTSAIQSISIKKEKGSLFLDRVGRKWVVNKKFTVRPQLVTLLLFGLNKMEIKRPIENNRARIVNQINTEGIEVNVVTDDGQRTFKILSNPNDINSSYFYEERLKAPYIVYVPGVKGELSNLIGLEEKDWRTRDIFKSTYRSLEKINVSYHDKKQEGFEIYYKENNFYIPGIESIDTVKLRKYITLFGILAGEQYVTSDSLNLALSKITPAAEIKVDDIDDEKNNTLSIYFHQQTLYGKVEKTKDILILNPQVFKYVLVDKKNFVKK